MVEQIQPCLEGIFLRIVFLAVQVIDELGVEIGQHPAGPLQANEVDFHFGNDGKGGVRVGF